VQRPEANEGGREEEEKGLRISLREPERLHGLKTVWTTWLAAGCARDDGVPAACIGQALKTLSGAV
jgi:hypothetical protein